MPEIQQVSKGGRPKGSKNKPKEPGVFKKSRPVLALEKNNAGGYNVVFNPAEKDEAYMKIGLEYKEADFVFGQLRAVLVGLVDFKKEQP